MTLVCFLLVALPAAVQVTIAPDQPLPYVYIDDPLIIEFQSDKEIEIETQLVLQMVNTGTQHALELGRIHLHGGSGYWYAVHDAPRERGLYTAQFTMTAEGETFTAQARFCRIDRPASLQCLPIYAYCSGSGETCALAAIRSVGVDTIRCDSVNEQFEKLAQDASLFGAYLIVSATLEQARQFTEVEKSVIQAQCENIMRFDLLCETNEQNCSDIPDVLRQMGCPASASIVVPNAEAFITLLQLNPALPLRHATLMAFDWPDVEQVHSIQNTAARYGQEGWQVHVLCPVWQPRGLDQAARFVHTFLRYRAAGVSFVGINASVVADDMNIQEMMAYLNGLALRYRGNAFVGMLPTDQNVQAPVFRSGAGWFVAVWREQGVGTIAIPVDGALNLELTDALGNTVALPEIRGGTVELKAGVEPLYLSGTGGVILGRAALQQVVESATSITQSQELSEQLPPGVLDLVRSIMAEPQGANGRLRFLELLRVLPRLEEQWHTRKLPRQVVVPAIVALSRMARALCLVEEDRGEHFLEPLTDTLARAEELQSLYLTGSAGTAQARERGDWILGEVRRLIDEAETLDKSERKIEAAAVATLAEWRAHCLVPAAQADPSREIISEMQPIILPEPVDEEPETVAEADEGPAAAEEGGDTAVSEDVKPEPDAKKGSVKEIIHVVKSGDNPYNIAKKYNVSLDDFMAWNKLTRSSVLRIGQKLVVRVAQ